jgi:CelD/BcsL family acetyltransferase involved in cellulose biosynthesis
VLPSTSILFEKHLPKKLRQNIHRAQRELVTLGNVTLEKSTPENIEFFLNSFFKLQNDRWKNREATTVLQNTSLCSFYRTVTLNFVNENLVELYMLRIDNIDIASYYILHKDMSHFAYLGGFDPSFSHYSPGTVALYSIIQESIKYGIEMFDFMRGAEQYKYHWKPLTHFNYRLRILKK